MKRLLDDWSVSEDEPSLPELVLAFVVLVVAVMGLPLYILLLAPR